MTPYKYRISVFPICSFRKAPASDICLKQAGTTDLIDVFSLSQRAPKITFQEVGNGHCLLCHVRFRLRENVVRHGPFNQRLTTKWSY
jgi:hypothetical protein